jgi:hypothetical protein
LDKEQRARLRKLSDRIIDAREMVSELEEVKDLTPRDAAACHEEVAAIVAEYRAILDQIPAEERDEVERRSGRAVVDLRQYAACLPEPARGSPVPLATDTRWTVPSAVPATTAPAAASHVAQPSPPAPTGPQVGREIEAWCGPCKGLRTHTIVAMVGGEPKQVICQSCKAKHNFRLTPARRAKSVAASQKKKLTQGEIEARKNEEARTALQKELTEATDVRPFSERGRYRAGQIIEHPTYGRGKVEHVTRGSILVRFRSGLRPLTTY